MNNVMRIRWPAPISLNIKSWGLLLTVIIGSNMLTLWLSDRNNQENVDKRAKGRHELYLLSEAKTYVYDVADFEQKVRSVSRKLDIPPEWLMAVMHSESRFDATVRNYKGSGATGLIQFMPATAKDHDITLEKLRNMNHTQQLDFVYNYLNEKRKKYRDFENLTDLYIAILYPMALKEDYCYTLYEEPEAAYRQNVGLDQDRDGRVTIQDIDKFLKRIYPTAYMRTKEDAETTVFDRITSLIGK